MRTIVALVFGLGLWLSAGHAALTAPQPRDRVLESARSLAAESRYDAALDLLEPHLQTDLGDPIAWEIAAEAARCNFHLGRYRQAHALLQDVVRARPVVIEPALYLEATAYLLGDHRQAFGIFEAVLRGGAQDLYLAVTLPGRDAFLAESEVQELLRQYARPLRLRPEMGSIQGLEFGEGRTAVARGFGIDPPEHDSMLTARAGPFRTWTLSFDDRGRFVEVVLHAENLRLYTPFVLDLKPSLTWTSSPLQCLQSLGQPDRTSASDDGTMVFTWDFDAAGLDIVFSRPESSPGESPARIELIRMVARPETPAGDAAASEDPIDPGSRH